MSAASPGTGAFANFTRAESDLYFGGMLKDSGAIGKFLHRREPARIDNQTVIRLNRDTLYSSAVFDLDAGPVTITLPDAGKRFMSMQVINEDHYVPAVVYGAGQLHLDKGEGRHALCGRRRSARWSIRPIRRTSSRSTRCRTRSRSARRLPASSKCRTGIRPARRRCATRCWCSARRSRTSRRRSAPRQQVDPIRHLIGTAAAWGGNPDKDATYLNVTPAKNDGTTVYKLNVKDVPVDALLVGQPLQRRRLFREEPVRRLFAQQHHRQEERRWLDRDPVRRLRRQDSELPADHEGLELHRAALSAARRNPERQVEIPGAAAGELRDRP